MKYKWYLALALLLSLAPAAISQNINPWHIERTAHRLTHALRARGFEVHRGYVKLWEAADCDYTFERIGLCLGNNPAAPYVVVAAPPWPDEAVIPKISCVFAPCHWRTNDVFRLDPREALIMLVQMPPPARFFSEQSWMFTRQGTYDTNSDTYKNMVAATQTGVLPDFALPVFFRNVPLPENVPNRIFVGSMLSNPINNVVIERQATTSFGSRRYFIVTPDEYVNTAVRNAFAEIAVPEKAIFTEQIPSNLNVGLDLAADDFLTFFRYAQPDDGGGTGTLSSLWRKVLPIAVLRVRHSGHTPQPYPAFTTQDLEPRTAFPEYTFQSDLFSLVSAVSSRWGQHCAKPDCSDLGAKSFIDVQRDPIWMVGPRCEAVGENCLLDNWDATYHIYGRVTLDQGEVYAVAGTLGTRTGNATYVGLSINEASRFVGVANLSDNVLQDTANGYAGPVQNTGYFYLYYFARDCSVVKNVTGEKNCFTVDQTMIPPGESIVFASRDYIRQGTQRGPDSSLVLPPMLIRVR